MSLPAGEPVSRSLQTPGQAPTFGYSDRPEGPLRAEGGRSSFLHAGLQGRPHGRAHGAEPGVWRAPLARWAERWLGSLSPGSWSRSQLDELPGGLVLCSLKPVTFSGLVLSSMKRRAWI